MAEPRYLLDTNILIYLAEARNGDLIAHAEEKQDQIVTSSLCLAEALSGDRTPGQIAAILELVRAIPVLAFDAAAAEAIRAVPFARRRVDRFIAAQALRSSLIVVTNNEADFQDVPGLVVENWNKDK